MSDKRKTEKIDRIGATKGTRRVDPTAGVQSVGAIRPTAGVQGVGRVGGVQSAERADRVMTGAQRERLLGMIQEEAEKLFPVGSLPAAQREVVKRAVMMAIDAGIIVKEESTGESSLTPAAEGVSDEPKTE